MKIIFILLCIFIGLFILSHLVRENYTDLDKTFLTKYNTFMSFYNQFMENYTKAIITSYGTDQPAPEPSVGSKPSTPKQPSTETLNTYIKKLITKEGKQFPPITEPLPTISTSEALLAIQSQIPTDTEPFQHALEWMNTNLSTAHKSLGSALRAIQGFTDYDAMEFFDDICQQITSCQQAQQANQQQEIVVLQKKLSPVFDSFMSLQTLLDKNNELIATSKKIQNQAQSGSLLPKIPSRPSPYTLPPGGNKLQDLEKDDPEKYKKYQQNYGQYVDMKNMFNQINSVLR